MATDRQTYRQTDTVNIWGFVRERDTGRVPQELELRLMSGWGYTGTDDAPPISSVAVRPDATGAFSESIKFSDLPYGSYSLQLWSGRDRIADSWFSVALIRKPAYQLALETDRHVLLAGDRVTLHRPGDVLRRDDRAGRTAHGEPVRRAEASRPTARASPPTTAKATTSVAA